MKDLYSRLTDQERAEIDSNLCGSHDEGAICRDCIAIYALRAILEMRSELGFEKLKTGPRHKGLRSDVVEGLEGR